MKYVLALAIFLLGAFSGYYFGLSNNKAEKEVIEDLAFLNILNGVALYHLEEKQDFKQLKPMIYSTVSNNLEIFMKYEGQINTEEYEESKARGLNAMFLRWKNDPPSHFLDFENKELREWSISKQEEYMLYLKQYRDKCLNNTNLKCKNT